MKRKHPAPQWRSYIGLYDRLKGVQFASESAFQDAMTILWEDVDVKGMPWDLVGNWTVIVPAEAVDLLAEKGLQFTQVKVASPDSLPIEKLARLRSEQGTF